MRTNIPIIAAVALLFFLLANSCSGSAKQDGMTEDKMEFRDYPKGRAQDTVQQ